MINSIRGNLLSTGTNCLCITRWQKGGWAHVADFHVLFRRLLISSADSSVTSLARSVIGWHGSPWLNDNYVDQWDVSFGGADWPVSQWEAVRPISPAAWPTLGVATLWECTLCQMAIPHLAADIVQRTGSCQTLRAIITIYFIQIAWCLVPPKIKKKKRLVWQLVLSRNPRSASPVWGFTGQMCPSEAGKQLLQLRGSTLYFIHHLLIQVMQWMQHVAELRLSSVIMGRGLVPTASLHVHLSFMMPQVVNPQALPVIVTVIFVSHSVAGLSVWCLVSTKSPSLWIFHAAFLLRWNGNGDDKQDFLSNNYCHQLCFSQAFFGFMCHTLSFSPLHRWLFIY